MKSRSKAVAYPGLPVVFAEGFRDVKRRISGHSHASLAITDLHEMAKTETAAELIPEGAYFTLNGMPASDARAKAVSGVIHGMLALATDRTGVKLESVNHGILTGSSDSGAAALVTALDDVLELGLPVPRLVELAKPVSETAYRSLVGGLSQCIVDRDGGLKVTALKKASFFRDMNIYAVAFDGVKRFSADDLHTRVVNHKNYPKRPAEVDRRLEMLPKLLERQDLVGFMHLMENEARTVHAMFSETGMEVIKPEMKAVTDIITGLRESGVEAFWNVAGGSAVYVFTLNKHAKEVTRELKNKNYRYRPFKVADGAKAVI